MLFLAIGFVVGLYCGLAAARWLRLSDKPLRTVRYDYTPPVAVEPAADVEQWTTYLAAFGLQCALGQITSERAVCKAGIVESPMDYRAYAGLLRRYGVWVCRGQRYPTRWLDRRPAVGVGRLRDAILRGRIVPRWPSSEPPPVRSVTHAQKKAD